MGFVFTVMVVLYGIICLIIKHIVCSTRDARIEGENTKNRNATTLNRDEWKMATHDREYEIWLRETLDNGGEEAEKLQALAIRLACGEEWFHKVPKTNTLYQRILLANRGKLRSYEASFGLYVFFDKRMSEKKKADTMMAYSKMHMWVAGKLRENGVDAIPTYLGHDGEHYLTMDGAKSGKFGWKSIIPVNEWCNICGETIY